MHLLYISPSNLPSKTANSVHVMNQCMALSDAGVDVTLVARRTVRSKKKLLEEVAEIYGFDSEKTTCKLLTYYSSTEKAVNVWIALFALFRIMFGKRSDVILSRNLYAAFAISVILRKPIIFETHQLEIGFRKFMQRCLLRSKQVKVVVISDKLKEYLEEYHAIEIDNLTVLHDAAPKGINPVVDIAERRRLLSIEIPHALKWNAVCGYFGHLYPGRGVEIIEEMAAKRPNVLFMVYGGNPGDVLRKRGSNSLNNICFVGHITHPAAQQLMVLFDILLMPYQKSVSIGIGGHDTARWMSPMKMFEYMASGVPIISSDLPVLREVLRDGKNSLLVPADDSNEWVGALDRLIGERGLSHALGRQGHEDYLSNYTWNIRAKRLLDIMAIS